MTEKVTFEKVVADGQALGYWSDKALFVPGPMAGETAEVRITNDRTKSASGVVEQYVDASADRHEALEAHYSVCSPWQAVDYTRQLELKTAMLKEAFARPELALEVEAMVGAELTLGYRNKLEFRFIKAADGGLELAFHDRGSRNSLVPTPDGCLLGSERMNKAAVALTTHLMKLDLADLADSLMIRESQTRDGMVAIITLKAAAVRNWQQLKLNGLTGVAVIVKRSHSKIETLWSEGSLALGETILGVEQFYPWDSFFQTNVPMFQRALEKIAEAVPDDSRVVDLYGGAGSIGLALARKARSVVGVDIVRASVEVARRNGKRSGLTNYRAIIAASERMDPAIVRSADVVIVDPPRAGLVTKVVDTLIDCAPERIIYLSCNPITQVRDLIAFKNGGYKIGRPTGFDFYPGTLHLESLVVLTKFKKAAK